MRAGAGLATLVLAVAAATAQAQVKEFSERIVMAANGSAAVEMRIATRGNEPLLVPLGNDGVRDLVVGDDGGVLTAKVVSRGGVHALAVSCERECPADLAFTVRFTAPAFYDWAGGATTAFGNRSLTYRFVNSQPAVIREYSMRVLLPPGFVVNTVEETEPALSEKTPVAPFHVVAEGGRAGLVLRARDLSLGQSAMVRMRFKREGRSGLLLTLGVALAVAYLVRFRSIVSGPPEQVPGAGA